MEISALVKCIAKAKGLSQKALAEILGVPLDRVKSLTSGKVKKLAPEESKALVDKLHVRAQHLATGEGPLFMSPQELELERRLAAVKTATQAASKVADRKARYEVQQEVFEALVMALTTEEQGLVQNYRLCAPDDKDNLCKLAARLAITNKGAK